jgi:hypothetical protein
MASLTTAIFLGVRTVFTQPPFFFSLEVSNPGLAGMGLWNSMIAMNPDLSSKFTQSDHKTVTVFVKRVHSKSTLCSSPRLHCFQVGSKMAVVVSTRVAEPEKQCCKIAQFTDETCSSKFKPPLTAKQLMQQCVVIATELLK